MALFFDSAWFDARLRDAGLSHATVAAALGLSEIERAELWKDQRELRAGDVRVLSALLGVPAAEIASRAGISTPVPKDVPRDVLEDLRRQLVRIEKDLAEIKSLIVALGADRS
jgi:hypothetical protein